MTTAGDVAPAPAAEPADKPNVFQRIAGVLFSPGETFAAIARRPDIAGPLVIFLILSIAGGIVAALHVDWQASARETVEMNPKIPADRVDSAARMTASIMKITAYASPVIALVFLLIVTGVMLLAFRMFGGEGDFRQYFSVTLYAWVPRMIKGLLGLVVIGLKGSPTLFELQNPLMSNPAFLFDFKTQQLAYTAAMALDIFSIWSLILMIIGYAAVSRFSRGKSAAVVISLWAVVTLMSLIGPAMQASRSNS